jgi:hypothetical protein
MPARAGATGEPLSEKSYIGSTVMLRDIVDP